MKSFETFRKSDKGASLILVTIFSTIVIGIVVTLVVISAMLLSNANKQKSQDQAFELATSLSARLEELILNEDVSGNNSQINLDDFINVTTGEGVIVDFPGTSGQYFDGIPDSSVKAVVKKVTNAETGDYYELTVTATAARETYIKRSEYSGSALMGYSRR